MSEQQPEAVVRYTGPSHEHTITAAQWKKAGVDDQHIVRWNRENGFEVKVSDLSDAAVEVLKREPSFTVS